MVPARRLALVVPLAFLIAAGCASDQTSPDRLRDMRVAEELGLPANFRSQYTHYADVYCPDLDRMRSLWANDAAMRAAGRGNPMPTGAVLVAEMYALEFTPEGEPRQGPLHHIAVSRRVFSDVVTTLSDWKFSGRNVDLTSIPPNQCAGCHENAVTRGYVFTGDEMGYVARASAARPVDPLKFVTLERSAECH